jgi:CheY-like chemotaxis protein
MAKIIIIDDEPAMVEVIVTLCRDKGHQVFPFNSAPKAIEQLDVIQPQVVIADIKMETMTGFDVLRHIREHHRQTAVILITAYASVETARGNEDGRLRLRHKAVQNRRAPDDGAARARLSGGAARECLPPQGT